ncbi:MAG: hypothetical protein SVM79_01895 [Chloroflexota bacterium]|nr:hypothetical protein [Chloroflexota bacterium]
MTLRDSEALSLLTDALSNQFSDEEASNLAKLLSCCCQADSISYEEIDIGSEWKDDVILLAYEERVMLPMKSLRGSAWEDRVLTFSERERYHMPRVVRFLVARAQRSGQWFVDDAIEKVLEEAGERQIQAMVGFFTRLKSVAPKYELEAGLMQSVKNELGLGLDMHDSIDRFVRCGIISPCTQRSLHTGFSLYQVNPCLYWKS